MLLKITLVTSPMLYSQKITHFVFWLMVFHIFLIIISDSLIANLLIFRKIYLGTVLKVPFAFYFQHLKKKNRVRMIEFFIDVAKECFNIGNFNSLMAIIAGINMSPVSRLKKTVSVCFLLLIGIRGRYWCLKFKTNRIDGKRIEIIQRVKNHVFITCMDKKNFL